MGDAPLEAGLSGEMQALYQRILRLQSMGHTAAAAAAPYMGLALAALDGDDSPWSDELRRNTGERLKAARDRLGLSQVAVAQKSGLSERTKEVEPVIRQLFVGRGSRDLDQDGLERKLYVIRKTASAAIQKLKLTHSREYYVPSMSCRTVIYKGLLLADQAGVARHVGELNDLFAAELAARSSAGAPRSFSPTTHGRSSSIRLLGCSAMRSSTWRR